MIYEDLEPRKQAVIAYIKVICEVTDKNPVGFSAKMPSVDEWVELRRLLSFLREPSDKLEALLKSQIMSGNVQGAIKVIRGCQSRKFNGWGYLLISPITVPILIIANIFWAPVALFKWIARNV